MEPTKTGSIYFVAGAVILFVVSKFMKRDFKMWAILSSCAAAGLCAALIPNNAAGINAVGISGTGIVSLVAMITTLKFSTNEGLEEVLLPIFITRLSLVPVIFMVGTW